MEAAFFDLDKTVISRASMVAFGKPLYREGLISRWLVLRALYGQLVYLYIGADEERLARMRDSVLALTKGWEQRRIRAIVEETLQEVVEPIVYDEALDLIAMHQSAGRPVFIVSASPEEIVAPLARYLGVDAYLATTSRIDADGRYTGETDFYCYGPHKAVAMAAVAAERGIDLNASWAYSDSATDLPMLECVGHPVVVNPDRELARVAREREWEIQTFERNVRLRDRVPMPSARKTTAVGGAVVSAGVGAAVLWWWLSRRAAQTTRRHQSPVERAQSALGSGLAELRRRGPSWPRPRPGRQRSRGGEASSWGAILRRA
jgi:HAD superfamily hydrolase (TIGR01490 family)